MLNKNITEFLKETIDNHIAIKNSLMIKQIVDNKEYQYDPWGIPGTIWDVWRDKLAGEEFYE